MYIFLPTTTENTPQRAKKTPLLNIVPSQASILDQSPNKAITLWPRKLIPNFLPLLNLPPHKLLGEQLLIPRRNSVYTLGIGGPSQNIIIQKSATIMARKNVLELSMFPFQTKDRPFLWVLPSCLFHLPLKEEGLKVMHL